jgi:ribosomal protein S18 acetylase RimI-like enzyme
VCIESFFGTADRLNPVRSMQLATLLDEQFADLRSRFGGRAVGGSVYLQAVDADGAMVGFVEVGITQSLKYGMEQYGVPVRDERPYLANLSVRPASRRQGVGRRLVHACEEMVRSWGYDELILQVEDSNQHARNLYRDMGYIDLYTDATGRKYELSGMSIKNVRINKVTLRKALVPSAAKNPFATLWGQLSISQG